MNKYLKKLWFCSLQLTRFIGLWLRLSVAILLCLFRWNVVIKLIVVILVLGKFRDIGSSKSKSFEERRNSYWCDFECKRVESKGEKGRCAFNPYTVKYCGFLKQRRFIPLLLTGILLPCKKKSNQCKCQRCRFMF